MSLLLPKKTFELVAPLLLGAGIGSAMSANDKKSRIKGAITGGLTGLAGGLASMIGARAGSLVAMPLGLLAGAKYSRAMMPKEEAKTGSMLAGTALGALGGAAIAPKGHRVGGAITGGAAGALTGGAATRIINKLRPNDIRALPTAKEALTNAMTNTGVTAVANSISKKLSKNKNSKKSKILTTAAPFVDDAALLARAI